MHFFPVLPAITTALQYSITPKKSSRHDAARVDFLGDSLLQLERHDRLTTERARWRRIQRLKCFAHATILRPCDAEARLAAREALQQRDPHLSVHLARSRSISLHQQQSLLFAKCSGGCCGQVFSPGTELRDAEYDYEDKPDSYS